MTILACVGYPTLDESDHQWIESFRERHDPQASRIRAHFTLVFPSHITVGGSATFDSCQRLAAGLNRETLAVTGVIEQVDLIEVTNEGIKSANRFALEH